jgi:uncharacterized protein (DUF433 family)
MTRARRITIAPNTCHGNLCVRGLRYPVEHMLEFATQLSRVKRLEFAGA